MQMSESQINAAINESNEIDSLISQMEKTPRSERGPEWATLVSDIESHINQAHSILQTLEADNAGELASNAARRLRENVWKFRSIRNRSPERSEVFETPQIQQPLDLQEATTVKGDLASSTIISSLICVFLAFVFSYIRSIL